MAMLCVSTDDFRISATATSSEASTVEVTLSNSASDSSAKPLAFKMKCTQPDWFVVRPRNGVVPPGGSCRVQITLVAYLVAATPGTKVQFLVEYRSVEANEASKDPRDLLGDKTQRLSSKKMMCTVAPAAAVPAPPAAVTASRSDVTAANSFPTSAIAEELERQRRELASLSAQREGLAATGRQLQQQVSEPPMSNVSASPTKSSSKPSGGVRLLAATGLAVAAAVAARIIANYV